MWVVEQEVGDTGRLLKKGDWQVAADRVGLDAWKALIPSQHVESDPADAGFPQNLYKGTVDGNKSKRDKQR